MFRWLPGALALSAAAIVASAQPRTLPHSTLPADPASDLVRTRTFLTTTASSSDLTVDGVSLANAVFTVRSGGVLVRARTDGNTVHLTGNTQGETADVEITMILAGVAAHLSVGWTLALGSAGHARLEVQNLNRDAARAVDVFDTAAAGARFSSQSDLLRDGGPLPGVPAAGTHLQLAFFYPWYDLTTWSSPEMLDHPAQRYSIDNPTDMTRVMAQAKDAGLDALVVSWQGKDFEGGWNHRRMLIVLEAAQKAGLRIATLLETTVANPQHDQTRFPPDPDTVLAWLEDVVDFYTPQPAYLRVDGRPVVFAYAGQRLAESQWIDVLGRLRGTGRDIFLIGEGNNATRLSAFNGLFFYASNVFQGDEIRDFDRAQSLTARTYHLLPNAGGRRLWVATVSPGYDDTRLADGRVARVSNRDGGRYYDRQWHSAIDMRADWIVVTSWNEWWENSEIEPSERYGDFSLRATKSWTSLFRIQW